MIEEKRTGVEERKGGMVLKHQRWTYMGAPYDSFLWTQWTSEKLYLGTGTEERVVEWMDEWRNGGMEGEKDKTIKTKEWNKHDT